MKECWWVFPKAIALHWRELSVREDRAKHVLELQVLIVQCDWHIKFMYTHMRVEKWERSRGWYGSRGTLRSLDFIQRTEETSSWSSHYQQGHSRLKTLRCCCLLAKSYPTLCHPMDCSLPDSSVHGILQTRILEWVAIPFSRGSSRPRIEPESPALAGGFITTELSGKPTNAPYFPRSIFAPTLHQFFLTKRAYFLAVEKERQQMKRVPNI